MNPTYRENKIDDYIGKKFGYLTVIGETAKTHQYSNSWDFKCVCGAIISDQPARVLSGHRKSCGKCVESKRYLSPKFDAAQYIGKKSNMLTAVGIAPRLESDRTWKLDCVCDCGNHTSITPSQFNRGVVKSCGCLRRSGTRMDDGRSLNSLYGIWSQMMRRCYNSKTKYYGRYGARGISVCDDWHSFNNFAEWAASVGGRPHGTSLDRINNDGNYEPSNCRWATDKQQHRNTSANIVIEYNGEKKTLVEWSESTGIKWAVLHNRYIRGWNTGRMFTEPVHQRKSSIKTEG